MLALAMLATGAFLQLTAPAHATAELTVGDRVAPLTMLMFAAVGGVLVWRRPEHPFGWVMVVFAALQGLNGTTSALVQRHTPPASIVVDVASWVQSWIWIPALSLLALGILLFPDGRLPSRRWRHVLRVELVGLVGVVVLAVALWPHRGPDLVELGDAWPGFAGRVGKTAVLPLVFSGFVASLVSLFIRYRNAAVIVRLQLKWLMLAVTLLGVALISAALADVLGFGGQWWQDLFGVAGLFFLPVAIGIAVLRYRLLEIERILSRTVSYLLLTGVLLGVYASGVLGVGTLLPGESSDLLVAGSTLAVAALFRPLRSRIQSIVDRRFNRARYDASRTVDAFGARLRDEIDLSTLARDLRDVAASALEPRAISVWLREVPR
ncbi:MAG: hypothetical protein KY469_15390 [Actinobacteria bacterium]|nr:hypothetical protein [Actinomycetota bacterium]